MQVEILQDALKTEGGNINRVLQILDINLASAYSRIGKIHKTSLFESIVNYSYVNITYTYNIPIFPKPTFQTI